MNSILTKILDLEKELKKLNQVSSAVITIKTDDLHELKIAATDLGEHVYEPFELSSTIKNFQFIYRIKDTNSTIIVQHTEVFKMVPQMVRA